MIGFIAVELGKYPAYGKTAGNTGNLHQRDLGNQAGFQAGCKERQEYQR